MTSIAASELSNSKVSKVADPQEIRAVDSHALVRNSNRFIAYNE
jgi:hypothetical protein